MNFQFLNSSYDLLIHNVQDNILKTVHLDQMKEVSLDETMKEYVEMLSKELDLENFKINWPTETKAEIYITETRVKRGWIYNSSASFDVLLYQIRPVEVFGTFSKSVESETQTNDTDGETDTDMEKDMKKDMYKEMKDMKDMDRNVGVGYCESVNFDERNLFNFRCKKRTREEKYSPFNQPDYFEWRKDIYNPFDDFPSPPKSLQKPLTPSPFFETSLCDSLKTDLLAELTTKLSTSNFGLSSTALSGRL